MTETLGKLIATLLIAGVATLTIGAELIPRWDLNALMTGLILNAGLAIAIAWRMEGRR